MCALGLLSAMTACQNYETAAGDPMKSRIYTLDNGLKVYMTVNKEEPRIQTYIAVRSGGKNDPHETTGLAHYFEHLMFKGTEQFGTSNFEAEKPMLDEIERLFEEYRSLTDPAERNAMYKKIDSVSYEASKYAIPNEYDKLMGMIGARGTNAWTSQDETVFTEDIPSNQVENWAKIQADRFRNNVIRGFHTELEAVYEEKNMSLTRDNSKLFEALQNGLFPHHPYGNQTVLGTQEQLKNPSITNIKNYYKTYYVPNNVAICLSGDFDPAKTLKIIEKYFGSWEPNPNIPKLEYPQEEPITTPIVKNVYGPQAEAIALAWRLPGSRDLKTTAVADIAGSILSNGQAGLIDVNINQQQKAMFIEATANPQPDYSLFLAYGMPKQGQTLEEVRDLTLEQIAKLSTGEFDESLITSTVNNIRLRKMRNLESNAVRANMFVDAFIAEIPWKDACHDIERYSQVTKQDIMDFAAKYLSPESYVLVNKLQGEDKTIQKMVAPPITPIETNRDKSSAFLEDVKNSEVKPIEPKFVDFSKDMSKAEFAKGVELLYKKNELNDIASVQFIWNTGIVDDPTVSTAFDYIAYLGTPSISAAEIGAKMYSLGCSYRLTANDYHTSISVSGLSENLPEAVKLVEDLVANAQGNDEILSNLKSDLLKMRTDAKSNQSSCFNALVDYLQLGPEYIKATTMTDAQIASLTSEELLQKARNITQKGHRILYYGPWSESKARTELAACHKIGEDPEVLVEKFTNYAPVSESKVLLAPYVANNFYYMQYFNLPMEFAPANSVEINLFNNYFGAGMNGIVFQEMREARGLAYSAYAYLGSPSFLKQDYSFYAYIASQNDKLKSAVEAFDLIINDMPESEKAFAVAKDGLLSQLRTKRINGSSVLSSYMACERLGMSEPIDKLMFETLSNMTLEDVKATQQKYVANRKYAYGILGDAAQLDMAFLRTLGPVQKLSLEDIFGY